MKEVVWNSAENPPVKEGKYLVICKRVDELNMQIRSLRPTKKRNALTWSANTNWPALTITWWTELPKMPSL